MKIRRLNLGRLFYNNKIVMLFSIMFAFIAWIMLSTSSTETTSKVITDIPISIPLSESAKESGLAVFGKDDIKAEISVTGNRLILGQLTKNDIQVTAQQSANMINSIGKYTLELNAKKNSLLTDYEFTSSVSPKFITVVVDRYKSQEFDITPEIKYTTNPDYFVSPISLSEPKVTISGPETVVSGIAKVSVNSNKEEILSKTTELNDLPINLFDSDGNKVNTKNLTLSTTKINATITILPRRVMKIKPEFTSIPPGLNINNFAMQVTPETIEVAAPQEALYNLNEIQLEAIDFSKINLEHNQFEQALKLPADCRSLSNVDKAVVKLNLSGYQAKTVTTSKITFKNLSDNQTAYSQTMNIPVIIIGPVNQIHSLTDNDISIEVDMSDKENFEGNTEMPANIKLSDNINKCWTYGVYSINIVVNKK